MHAERQVIEFNFHNINLSSRWNENVFKLIINHWPWIVNTKLFSVDASYQLTFLSLPQNLKYDRRQLFLKIKRKVRDVCASEFFINKTAVEIINFN